MLTRMEDDMFKEQSDRENRIKICAFIKKKMAPAAERLERLMEAGIHPN